MTQQIRNKLQRKFYKKHRLRLLQKKKIYYAKNKIQLLKKHHVWYLKNKDKIKKYNDKNKIKIARHKHKWYLKNKITVLEYTKKFHQKYNRINKDFIKQIHKNYYLKNKKQIIRKKLNYFNKCFKLNILFRLKIMLRNRIRNALKNNHKSGSAVRDLGCSIAFLKEYLEKKFYSNMSWSNWGKYWELDHIVPLYKFDLTKREQFIKACNYKNLQPLTIEDHRKKTNKEAHKRNNK